jgi:type I restriction enzyme S subunit
LLLTVVGTIGETAIVTRDMAGWNVARAIAVVPVQPEIGAYWVKLALCAQAPKQMMESHLNTTVQPTLNLGVVGKLPIVLPPTNLRDRIAAILGAYDDLIEVNRRRIVALEEMAQRLPVILRRGGELSGPLT